MPQNKNLLQPRDSYSDNESEVTYIPKLLLMRRERSLWALRILAASHLFFFILSVILGFVLVFKKPSISKCVDMTSVWSPANKVVKYSEFDFDNAFAHKTKYRGPPTPELERNWEDLWRFNGLRFPEDKLHLINRTINLGEGRTPRKAVDEKGGYHYMIDVIHQLHCLNVIRQSTWQSYYKTHSHIVRTPLLFRDSDVGIRNHVDHCIETLRLVLMCHGDTTPSLLRVDPATPLGFSADFSMHRKCRNFWDLRDWTRDNQIMQIERLDWQPIMKNEDDIKNRQGLSEVVAGS